MKKLGYKLFEMNEDGCLFPLFIGKNKEIKVGEWLHAEHIPSKYFSIRSGWHLGTQVPDAPWLRSYDGSDTGCYKSKRGKKYKRAWCLCEYNTNNNYNEEVKSLPKKCFEDMSDKDGYYDFKESGDRLWVISSDIKVIKILSEKERLEILNKKNYNEVKAFSKYKRALEKRMGLIN